MNACLDTKLLQRENCEFGGTGGVSDGNRGAGFSPAFLDQETHVVYASRFADGRLAPFHLIDGLPDELVISRHASGRISAIKATVVSGFVRDERFYSREEAARWMTCLHS